MTYADAASFTIFGYFSAILSNVLAAPEGVRTPCSQAASVLTETPNSCANFSCVKPVLLRVSTTGITKVLLSAFRAFICLTDKRRSSANWLTSRSEEYFISLIDNLHQRFIDSGRKIIKFTLRVNHKQINFAVFKHVVINDSGSTSPSVSFGIQTNLSEASAARYDISAQRIGSNPNNKLFAFSICPNLLCPLAKNRCFTDGIRHTNSHNVVEEYPSFANVVNSFINSFKTTGINQQ